MRKPLEVFAIDENLCRASGSIPYTSLVWTRRYYGCGEFMLAMPADIYDPSWAYIYADERPETGVIQKVEYSDTAPTPDGRDTVTVSGLFLESFLNHITFLVEQPEEQKVELPPPKMVGMAPKYFPTLWRDPNGGYVYKDKQGNFIDSTGKQVDGSSDWEEVYTHVMLQHSVDGSWTSENTPVYSSYNFAVNNRDGTVTVTSWWGGKTTEDIVLRDDRGNVFFERGSNVYIANGSINLYSAQKYQATMDAWKRGEEGVRYEVVTVKGPWQRTDTMEPITASDSVDQLFRWIQRFCGSSFIYVEPEIDGGLNLCIRVMMFIEKNVEPHHVYLRGARVLRKDLTAKINVAIDGPAGSGKSTIAKALSRDYKILYLDTGAMYRACALKALNEGADVEDEAALCDLMRELSLTIEYVDGVQHTILDGKDVSEEIRSPRVSMAASTVSKYPCVRMKMVEKQREIAGKMSCVLDGRDIGSYVLPDAEFKFFLTASPEVRARRRYDELVAKGYEVDFEELKREIERRDLQDSTREFSPLRNSKTVRTKNMEKL